MSPLAPGLHRLPPEIYHADAFADRPTLSSSIAKVILNQSPLHAWTASPRLNPDWEPTIKDTFDVGTAAHKAVLGAGSEWAVYPPEILGKGGAVSTKAAKEWAEEQREAGRVPIKAETEDKVLDMAESVSSVLAAADIRLEPARSELTALGEIDGVLCRCMVDNAPADPRAPLYDLKSCVDARPDAVMRAVMNWGYDLSIAHYLDTWKSATGEDRTMRLVFIEKTPPYAVTVAELDGEALDMARCRIRRARGLWDDCIRSGQWPAYPLAVLRVGLPDWFHTRTLEDETTREDWRVASGDKPTKAATSAAYRAQMPDHMKEATI